MHWLELTKRAQVRSFKQAPIPGMPEAEARMFMLLAALAALSTPPINLNAPDLGWPEPEAVETAEAIAPPEEPVVEAESVPTVLYQPDVVTTVDIRCPVQQCDLIVEVVQTTDAWRYVLVDGRGFTILPDVRNAIELPPGFAHGTYPFFVKDAVVRVSIIPHASDPTTQLASAFP